jgi:hypothetical protein
MKRTGMIMTVLLAAVTLAAGVSYIFNKLGY